MQSRKKAPPTFDTRGKSKRKRNRPDHDAPARPCRRTSPHPRQLDEKSSIQSLIEEGLRLQREKEALLILESKTTEQSKAPAVSDVEKFPNLPTSRCVGRPPSTDSVISLHYLHSLGLQKQFHSFANMRYQNWDWTSYVNCALPFLRETAVQTVFDADTRPTRGLYDVSAFRGGFWMTRHTNGHGRGRVGIASSSFLHPFELFRSNVRDAGMISMSEDASGEARRRIALLSTSTGNTADWPMTISIRSIGNDGGIEPHHELAVTLSNSHNFYHIERMLCEPAFDSRVIIYGEKDVAQVDLAASSSVTGPTPLLKIQPGSHQAVRTVAPPQSGATAASFYAGLRNGCVVHLDTREKRGAILCKPRDDPPAACIAGRADFCIDHISALLQTPGLLIRDVTGGLVLWDIRRFSSRKERPPVVNRLVESDPRVMQPARFFVSADERVVVTSEPSCSKEGFVCVFDLRRAWLGGAEPNVFGLGRTSVIKNWSQEQRSDLGSNWKISFAETSRCSGADEEAGCYVLIGRGYGASPALVSLGRSFSKWNN